ncbi:MAG: hypothetical protein JKP96_06545 [Oceanicaulis sp.]|jgi:hypothetical protein|nr:hypothetical protein [Oceanicaulis sp.]
MQAEAPSVMKAFQANFARPSIEQPWSLPGCQTLIVLAEDFTQASEKVSAAIHAEAQLHTYELLSISQISDRVCVNWFLLNTRRHGNF